MDHALAWLGETAHHALVRNVKSMVYRNIKRSRFRLVKRILSVDFTRAVDRATMRVGDARAAIRVPNVIQLQEWNLVRVREGRPAWRWIVRWWGRYFDSRGRC